MIKSNFKQAFTLAEVLIVLTILGIIAAVSMVTLKPAEFKAKGINVSAKKAMYDIDTATTEILLNDTVLATDGTVMIQDSDCNESVINLYKKYLTTVNKNAVGTYANGDNSFCLKSGTCIKFEQHAASSNIILPGDTAQRSVTPDCALIKVDVNDNDSPNAAGTDQFLIPLNKNGIKYD